LKYLETGGSGYEVDPPPRTLIHPWDLNSTPSDRKSTPSDRKSTPSDGKSTPSDRKFTPSDRKYSKSGDKTPSRDELCRGRELVMTQLVKYAPPFDKKNLQQVPGIFNASTITIFSTTKNCHRPALMMPRTNCRVFLI
jgi:hypothetical protein